ncbi:monoheme cytochrome C [Aggregatimonas sangjinii]|uniref:monoheme cytochrome C n=1 Tax=Aggregatimonas sangjinii TaxID=2583587 RepID=UPI001F1EA0D7|nr:monoheme cytochrome C [Aggregatimonas sangjinii]
MKNKGKFNKVTARQNKLKATFVVILTIAVIVLVFLLVDLAPSTYSVDTDDGEYIEVSEKEAEDPDKIENGIHIRTWLAAGDGLMLVVNNCTSCHSAKLVTQNRMSAERWTATIRWMQETQNLWDLGKNEEPIVNYLATYYAPIGKGRRQKLTNIEWYELKQ